ncbi:MAG: 4-hydroxy-3-methylbut-2-enyl diphosphate reductase, partial [Helicobacter japonicus]|nr:4-hydroxy-3-methylbut-2-enyl diphosphate reductase [Helicobacter japonicus]
MKIKLAEKYGFCFGVKRAIKIAEENRGAIT